MKFRAVARAQKGPTDVFSAERNAGAYAPGESGIIAVASRVKLRDPQFSRRGNADTTLRGRYFSLSTVQTLLYLNYIASDMLSL